MPTDTETYVLYRQTGTHACQQAQRQTDWHTCVLTDTETYILYRQTIIHACRQAQRHTFCTDRSQKSALNLPMPLVGRSRQTWIHGLAYVGYIPFYYFLRGNVSGFLSVCGFQFSTISYGIHVWQCFSLTWRSKSLRVCDFLGCM